MTETLDAAEVQRMLDDAPMSRFQIRALAILVMLSMLDGYDVVSISLAGPVVAEALGIGKTALGAVFSSGLLGMALGSLVLAPLADAWGRRAAILGALLLMMIGGIWCALVGSGWELAAARAVIGLGIGTLIAVTTPLAGEFANARRRAFAIAVTTMAFPLGAMVGGLLAAVLIRNLGWQSVFALKSVIAAVLVPVVFIWLPESPSFLLSSKKGDALEKLSGFLVRCGHKSVSILQDESNTALKRGYADLFAPGQISITLQLVAANALFAMVGYFWGSWLPHMIVDAGYTVFTASIASAINQLSGVIGGLLLGFATKWIKLRYLSAAALVGTGVALVLFGIAPSYLPLLILSGAFCAFCLHGGIAGLYATIGTSFQEHVRASGTGLAIGVGRITSSVSPLFAGWMFASGFERPSVSAAFAVVAVLSGLILLKPLRSAKRSELPGAQ
tara:strand:- start:44390 stop:45727 length:1338 start_codon:yes stop_codon:yes gene_type:complete